MQVYEKIKNLRKLKGWSQEEIAHKLDMTASGYGSIERGETDVKLSRLKDIATLFEIELSELFDINDKKISIGDNSQVENYNNQHINSSSKELQYELKKSRLIIEQQIKEINLLKQQNNDLREINNLLKNK
jgi:transcriptional regulator with XRE-family HTH domain